MTPESTTRLARLSTMLDQLTDLLTKRSVESATKPRHDAVQDVLEIVTYYQAALRQALQSNDVAKALKAANGAAGINKGLADQGAWLATDPDIRSLGVAISNEGLICAKLLRAELGLTY